MEIKPHPSLIEDPQATETRRGLPDHPDRRAGRDTGLGDGMRSGEFGLARDFLGEREQAFAKRLNHALGEGDQSDDTPTGEDGPRLLAVAGFSPVGTGLVKNAAVDEVREVPRLEAMIDRIEKAVAARSIDALPGAVSLTLDFGDIGGSIAGVTITLSPGAIDLVLSSVGDLAQGPYLQAAQMLADRLHARFPKRSVRILEAASRADPAPQGLAALSRLLDTSGDRS